MRVLVACEYSGTVRDAFAARGHDAWSCDLLPTERPGNHIQADVRQVLWDGWDLMIAHPPCTYLARAGARWFKVDPSRWDKAHEAFDSFMEIVNAPIPMIAVENPVGLTWQWYRRPDQVVHPWWFGDPMTKKTSLWLKELPPLMATYVQTERFVNWTEYGHRSPKQRSKTFPGMAAAMAAQWG